MRVLGHPWVGAEVGAPPGKMGLEAAEFGAELAPTSFAKSWASPIYFGEKKSYWSLIRCPEDEYVPIESCSQSILLQSLPEAHQHVVDCVWVTWINSSQEHV